MPGCDRQPRYDVHISPGLPHRERNRYLAIKRIIVTCFLIIEGRYLLDTHTLSYL